MQGRTLALFAYLTQILVSATIFFTKKDRERENIDQHYVCTVSYWKFSSHPERV